MKQTDFESPITIAGLWAKTGAAEIDRKLMEVLRDLGVIFGHRRHGPRNACYNHPNEEVRMDTKPTRFEFVLGFAVVATLATGFISLVMAAVASINSDWTGAGLSLTAAALAFGLLTNAVLRR